MEARPVVPPHPQPHGCFCRAQFQSWPSTEPPLAGTLHPAILRIHSSKAHSLPPSLEHTPTYWPHTLTELSSTTNTGLQAWPAACPILQKDTVGGWETQPPRESRGVCQRARGFLRARPNVLPAIYSLEESLKECGLGLPPLLPLQELHLSLSLPSSLLIPARQLPLIPFF